MKDLILALDQGTTGSTAFLLKTDGRIMGSHNVEFPQIFPKEGWVEHNPNDILKSVKEAISGVFQKTNAKISDVLSIGITNQRETVVYWDLKTGEPIGNAIVWQCRRTTKRAESLIKQKKQTLIRSKTGLPIDPYFSSTKMEWILKNRKSKNGILGTIDTFLLWHLTGGKSFYTEPSNASRTQVFNIKNLTWDKDLLKLFKIKEELLPEVLDSNADFGKTKGFLPLPDGISINGILGDQQSALFGQGAFNLGEAKCTFGTGSFILFNTGDKIVKSKAKLLSTVAWKLKKNKSVRGGGGVTYALEGGAFNCGSTIQWLRDSLEFFSNSKDIEELIKNGNKKNDEGLGELVFVPSFSGMGAPIWEPRAKGAFLGINRGTNKSQLSKAVLEGLSYQNAIIISAMEKDLGKKLTKLFVDGGASKNDLFMELQSSFLGKKLYRPENIETTAFGASLMAGLGAGVWSSLKELKGLNPVDLSIKGAWSSSKRLKKVRRYQAAFDSVLKYSRFD